MSDKKPMILVFAGPNGSGKSTITNFFEIVGTYTNADDIVKATGMSNINAAKLADESRYAKINVARVQSRVASGGHDVESKTIIDRYHKSIDNIKKMMERRRTD